MKTGELIRLVRVRFPGQVLPGTFLVGNLNYEYGQKVVALSERGVTIGYINSQVYEVPYSPEMGELTTIKREAGENDDIKYQKAYQYQREASHVFEDLVKKHDLPMNLQDVEFVSGGNKIIFHFTAPGMVDFRALLKDLGRELKSKIELRQIPEKLPSIRIGPCGPDLCTFVNSVMGNTQRKTCSENYCCLENNDRFYEERRSRLPKMNSLVSTHTGEMGKVQRVDFVKEEFEMLTDQGIIKRYVSELYKETLNKKLTPFPKSFEIISHDTKVVLGEKERLAKKKRELDLEYKKLNDSAKDFAENVWRNLNA